MNHQFIGRPGTPAHDILAGIKYELIATLCIKGKK